MSKDTKEPVTNQMNIDLPPDIAQGEYSNLVIVSHSSAEFILDFVKMLPGLPNAQVQSRIIMTPQHLKRLMFAIQENLVKYENNFGEVPLYNDPQMHGGGITMNGPMGLA